MIARASWRREKSKLVRAATGAKNVFMKDFEIQEPGVTHAYATADNLSGRLIMWLPEDPTQSGCKTSIDFMTEICNFLDRIPKDSHTVILLCGVDGWTTNPLNIPRFHLRYEYLNLQFVIRFSAGRCLSITYLEASGASYRHYSLSNLVEVIKNDRGDARLSSYCASGKS